jgi:hypothetical protein
VANLGDSRAVVGSLGRSNKIVAEPLTIDHNASVEEVRQELISRHPDDSQIVVLKHGVWRIKGIIQVGEQLLPQQIHSFGVKGVGCLRFNFFFLGKLNSQVYCFLVTY